MLVGDTVRRAMTQAREWLTLGCTVSLFPESLFSFDDGSMRPFKPGAFQLAYDTHADILPIYMDGKVTLSSIILFKYLVCLI
jgi:1-acyl-sn-glycerol-3-phosphate acyltransferase